MTCPDYMSFRISDLFINSFIVLLHFLYSSVYMHCNVVGTGHLKLLMIRLVFMYSTGVIFILKVWTELMVREAIRMEGLFQGWRLTPTANYACRESEVRCMCWWWVIYSEYIKNRSKSYKNAMVKKTGKGQAIHRQSGSKSKLGKKKKKIVTEQVKKKTARKESRNTNGLADCNQNNISTSWSWCEWVLTLYTVHNQLRCRTVEKYQVGTCVVLCSPGAEVQAGSLALHSRKQLLAKCCAVRREICNTSRVAMSMMAC